MRGKYCKYLHKLENKEKTIKIDTNQIQHNAQISSTKPKKNDEKNRKDDKQTGEDIKSAENVEMDMEWTKPFEGKTRNGK